MGKFIIEGGHRLHGEITPQGAKNEALQIICATLLTPQSITIQRKQLAAAAAGGRRALAPVGQHTVETERSHLGIARAHEQGQRDALDDRALG